MAVPVLYIESRQKEALDHGIAAAFSTASERFFLHPVVQKSAAITQTINVFVF